MANVRGFIALAFFSILSRYSYHAKESNVQDHPVTFSNLRPNAPTECSEIRIFHPLKSRPNGGSRTNVWPTSQPTFQPLTVPTTSYVAAKQTITGITISGASSMPFKAALIGTIEQTLGIVVTVDKVIVQSILGKRVLFTSLTISYDVTVDYALISYAETSLNSALINGDFGSVLSMNYGQPVTVDGYFIAGDVSIPTESLTTHSQSEGNKYTSGPLIAGICVIAVVVVAVVIIILLKWKKRPAEEVDMPSCVYVDDVTIMDDRNRGRVDGGRGKGDRDKEMLERTEREATECRRMESICAKDKVVLNI